MSRDLLMQQCELFCIIRKVDRRTQPVQTEQELSVYNDGSCHILRPAALWGKERGVDEVITIPDEILKHLTSEVESCSFFRRLNRHYILEYTDSDWRIIFGIGRGVRQLYSLVEQRHPSGGATSESTQ